MNRIRRQVLRHRRQRSARGEITVDIVSTPRGHSRLPDADDEIVDRALDIQLRADTQVTMITYDVGMSWRAAKAGLTAVKLDFDPVPEPPPHRWCVGAIVDGTSASFGSTA